MVLQCERVFLTLMSHIVTFCGKNIKETNDKINQTNSILKRKLEKVEYKKIQKTIASNKTATKKNLHQCKFKKYNNLQYKPKPAVKATNITDENENLKKATYAEMLQASITPTREISKTNNTDHNNNPNIQEKLRLLSPTNRYRRQGNSPSRKLPNSNIKNNDKYKRKVGELQGEIKKIKYLQETLVEHTILNATETSTSKSKDIQKTRTRSLY